IIGELACRDPPRVQGAWRFASSGWRLEQNETDHRHQSGSECSEPKLVCYAKVRRPMQRQPDGLVLLYVVLLKPPNQTFRFRLRLIDARRRSQPANDLQRLIRWFVQPVILRL